MNKIKKYAVFTFTLAVAVFVSMTATAEVPLGKGYRDLSWRMSIEQVKRQYPNIKIDADANVEDNEVFYEDLSGENTRYFRFYKNKLYWVRVVYADLSQVEFDDLVELLRKKYGKFRDRDYDDGEFAYIWDEYDVIIYVHKNSVVTVTYTDSEIELQMRRDTARKMEL